MSWLNFSWLTPKGSGKAEWQSRQEFLVCPYPGLKQTARQPAKSNQRAWPSKRALFRKMPIKTHTCYVSESEDGNSRNPPLGVGRLIAFEERQQKPQHRGRAEDQNTQHLSVDEPYLGRNQFEGLEHEQEIPLGLDAGGRRHKGICLDPQVPREDGGECAQHPQGNVPSHEFAQREVGKELHFTLRHRIGLPLDFQLGRYADPRALDQ